MKFVCSIFLCLLSFADVDAQKAWRGVKSDNNVLYGVKYFGVHNCYSGFAFFYYDFAFSQGFTRKLNDTVYKKLSAKELYIYATDHPESFRQICSGYPDPPDSLMPMEANLPGKGARSMSERQVNSLKKNRDSVIVYISECITKEGFITLDDLHNIVMLNAWETIPVLQKISEKHQHTSAFVFTTYALLMKAKAYKPFLASRIYEALYAGGTFSAEIGLTPSVVAEMKKLTNDFYTWAKAQ